MIANKVSVCPPKRSQCGEFRRKRSREASARRERKSDTRPQQPLCTSLVFHSPGLESEDYEGV